MHDDINVAFDEVIKLQLRSNIALLSDGEQRGDMIVYLARDIPGLALNNGFPVVSGRISPPENPKKVQKVADYFMLSEKYSDIELKVTLTGPTALGVTCASRGLAKEYSNIMDFSLYTDIAEALRVIIQPLVEAKAYVQLDEPFISQGFTDLKRRLELIDYIFEGCDRSRCSVHICGYLGKQPLLEELAKLENINVMSHAFSAGKEVENIGLLKRSIFEDYDKRLGAGIISVSPKGPEEVDSSVKVASRLAEIVDRIGIENIAYAHPDCGLRATKPDLVGKIMKNFDDGVKQYELSLE